MPQKLAILDLKVAKLLQQNSGNIKQRVLERMHFVARLLILVLTRMFSLEMLAFASCVYWSINRQANIVDSL